jgi:hypothetical protein
MSIQSWLHVEDHMLAEGICFCCGGTKEQVLGGRSRRSSVGEVIVLLCSRSWTRCGRNPRVGVATALLALESAVVTRSRTDVLLRVAARVHDVRHRGVDDAAALLDLVDAALAQGRTRTAVVARGAGCVALGRTELWIRSGRGGVGLWSRLNWREVEEGMVGRRRGPVGGRWLC